ncbi:DsbA family oxidoreductase [Paenibacillus terrigena]|uniref:DsbA family oxidoreductase n=1 Tax=Paenibacillus terrigena TaxID=369333 RepID=UPI0028D401B9|nr:DsbA family oxidoreductase [Paenibacillus terrigena]
MKVEIWSDYQCPFCYIGKRQFEEALKQFPHQDAIEIVFKSFELDPNAPVEPKETIDEMLAAKYGMSIEQAEAMNADVAARAAEVGLTYVFDEMKPVNSLMAHRLTHFAATRGLQQPLNERLFAAYFTESKSVGDMKTLIALAVEVGLDREEVTAVLASDQFAAEVRADEQEGSRLGIQGVPFFVFNRRYAVSGAQSQDVFRDVLQKAWDESAASGN